MQNTDNKSPTLGSLFSGSGGFELAAALNGITPVWNSEIKPFPALVTSRRFPNTKQLGDVAQIDGAKVEPVDIITFGSPCFPAGTPVLTDKGYRAIEYIKEGERVLTHKNRFMRVLKTGSTQNQELYELNAQGILPLEATANHPFIVRTKYKGEYSNAYQKPLYAITENDYIGVPILTTSENPLDITAEEVFSLGYYLGQYNLFSSEKRVDEVSEMLFNNLSDKVKPFARCERVYQTILNLPDTLLKEFVKGYFEHDSLHMKHKTFCKTSDIEFAINLCLAIQKSFRVGCYICESKVFDKGKYIVSFNPNPDNQSWVVIDDVIWYPVYGVERKGEASEVYNLEVEDDHTYVAQNCIVHNCQDLSQAGKRAGLSGTRSCLFHEAIRIIKEMRSATNGEYPKYVVWENVPGAYSSNSGNDFRTVLEEIAKVQGETSEIPTPDNGKWLTAGEVVGDNYSIAWRTLDAQWWGVPQRRRRIFLVADCRGGSAGKILFESESLYGYTAQSGKEMYRAAEAYENGIGKPNVLLTGECCNNKFIPIGFDGYNSSVTGAVSSTLGINCGMSTGRCGLLCLNDQGGESMNVESGEISPTLRAQAHGNIPIICIQGSSIGRSDKNGPMGKAFNVDVSFTLNTIDQHAVSDEKARRFMPVECARLQGFPDWWCDGLSNENPSREDVEHWQSVWETYRKATNAYKKPKTFKQIQEWLKNPYSDGEMYIMWGNGVALPCVTFVLWAVKNEL